MNDEYNDHVRAHLHDDPMKRRLCVVLFLNHARSNGRLARLETGKW